MKRALTAFALLLALIATGCGGGNDRLAFQAVAGAADKTAGRKSARFEMSVQLHTPAAPRPLRVFSSGALDYARQRIQIELDLSEMARAAGQPNLAMRISMIFADASIYMKLPPAMLGGASLRTPWVMVGVPKAARMALGDMNQFGQNPADQLELLRAISGAVEKRGTREIRGVETIHYHAEIDLQKALEEGFAGLPAEQRDQLLEGLDGMVEETGLESIPVDVYLDGSGVVHRLVMDMKISLPELDDQMHAVTTMDLFDFGARVAIEPPPADEVTEVTEQMAGSLGLIG